MTDGIHLSILFGIHAHFTISSSKERKIYSIILKHNYKSVTNYHQQLHLSNNIFSHLEYY